MSIVKSAVGNLAIFVVYAGAIAGSIFWCTPFLFVLPFSPKYYMRISSLIVGSWMCFAVTWIQAVCGVTIRVYGDQLPNDDRQSLLLLNHRTRLDYLYFWSYLSASGMINQHKIVLKEELNLVPAAGGAMQSACFVFLRRNWQQDHLALERYLHFFGTTNHNTKLMIFPEGTDLRPDSVESSNKYAAKQGMPPYYYVLHPRTTGFVYLIKAMRALGRLDSVADLTVAYPANIPRAEQDLLLGKWPRVVDFFIDRYAISELPTDDEDLANWIIRRWSEKERFLKWYYSVMHSKGTSDEQHAYGSVETCDSKLSFKDDSVVHYTELDEPKSYGLIFRTGFNLRSILITTAMTFFALAVVLECYMNFYVLLYTIIVLLLSVPLTLYIGGWDKIMINYYWKITVDSKPKAE